MSAFCENCQNIVHKLFSRPHYQPAQSRNNTHLPNILEQRFFFLDNDRHIISISEFCKLCAFIKQEIIRTIRKDETGSPILPNIGGAPEPYELQLVARGGNQSRPASRDPGLQLFEIIVATSLDFGLWADFSGLWSRFSIIAAKGMSSYSFTLRFTLATLSIRKSRSHLR
ncbi:hypothetical protein BU16DRAFT_566060 [Lophium mytilinum]|uniref:Uncharacterized protein n=1 Tax=Lophium mytilinum TaxID=390894 RepID=A0A6A6QI56_9PEZI|nr:hypothetical protein BU16DRAFT_566060 [Lophium mytilinum]